MKQKLVLEINDTCLVVRFGDDYTTAEKCKTFFSFLLGFTYYKDQNKFVSPPDSLNDLLTQTIEFFKKKEY